MKAGVWEIEKSIKKVWELVPAAIFWGICNERNCRCFDEILNLHIKQNALVIE